MSDSPDIRSQAERDIYDEIFDAAIKDAECFIADGETSLSRIVSLLEQRGNARAANANATDPVERYGLVIGGDRSTLRPLSTLAINRLHRNLVQEVLAETLVEKCDQIVELGGGWGVNLFRLWLSGGGPREAEYVLCERSSAGCTLGNRLAALEPNLRFRSHAFDLRTPDLTNIVTGHRAIVFTCYSIAMLEVLPDDFFQKLLHVPNVIAGLHIEPVGWQQAGSEKSESVRTMARAYASTHRRNCNFLPLLDEAERRGVLWVDAFLRDHHSVNAFEAVSVIRWSRRTQAASRSSANSQFHPFIHPWRGAPFIGAPYRLGEEIVFSLTGNAGLYRRNGWSEPEEWGCWSDGEEARIVLKCESSSCVGAVLEADCDGFVHPGRTTLDVAVSAGGVNVTQWRFPRVDGSGYRARIPASAWSGFGFLEISFNMEGLRSPKDLGLSPDERLIGLQMRRLRLIEETSIARGNLRRPV